MLERLRKNKPVLAKSDNGLTLYSDPNLTLRQIRVGNDDMIEMHMHYTGHGGRLLYYREDLEKMARSILNSGSGLQVESQDRAIIALAIDMLISLSSGKLASETVERLKTVKRWFEDESK